MRARTWVAAALAAATAGGAAGRPARAQDNPNPDQLRKMYDDALGQLKAAQDRKNQLAAENEKLGQQVEALRKELAAAAARLEELKQSDADQAERTFVLRSHYAAWRQFVGARPDVAGPWRAFLGADTLANPTAAEAPLDRDWPAGADRPAAITLVPAGAAQPAATQPAATKPAPTQPAATQPAATQPTTQPAATQTAAAPVPPATQPATQPTPATQPVPSLAPPTTQPTTPPSPAPTPPVATRPAGP